MGSLYSKAEQPLEGRLREIEEKAICRSDDIASSASKHNHRLNLLEEAQERAEEREKEAMKRAEEREKETLKRTEELDGALSLLRERIWLAENALARAELSIEELKIISARNEALLEKDSVRTQEGKAWKKKKS